MVSVLYGPTKSFWDRVKWCIICIRIDKEDLYSQSFLDDVKEWSSSSLLFGVSVWVPVFVFSSLFVSSFDSQGIYNTMEYIRTGVC